MISKEFAVPQMIDFAEAKPTPCQKNAHKMSNMTFKVLCLLAPRIPDVLKRILSLRLVR